MHVTNFYIIIIIIIIIIIHDKVSYNVTIIISTLSILFMIILLNTGNETGNNEAANLEPADVEFSSAQVQLTIQLPTFSILL